MHIADTWQEGNTSQSDWDNYQKLMSQIESHLNDESVGYTSTATQAITAYRKQHYGLIRFIKRGNKQENKNYFHNVCEAIEILMESLK